MRSSIHCAAD